jgi:2-amino-4-hydroxy-6-hydroxymethyldihydropteridine diphosphokinase
MPKAYLGLGSNIDPRRAWMQRGADRIAQEERVEVLRASGLYETSPVDVDHEDWYLNAVLEVETDLAVLELFEAMRRIEVECGRPKASKGRRTPRTLDIDLLLYGDRIVREPGIRIPHPQLHERLFVLQPLCDLVPHRPHPELGVPFRELLQTGDFPGQQVRAAGVLMVP